MVHTSNDQWFDRRKNQGKSKGNNWGRRKAGGEKIKEKVKETIGMGSGGEGGEGRKGELGPGAATEVEEEVAKTSSDSPTKRVEGSGKALGKEGGAE